MRSCLVMRSTVDSSALTGVLAVAACSDFETTDRGDFLPGTVAGVTLRRLGAEDLALPFLGTRFGFRDFSMERLGMVWASFGSRPRPPAAMRSWRGPHEARSFGGFGSSAA